MGDEEGRLPGAPLVELTVGGETEDAPIAAVEDRSQRHAGRQREPVAEAAGRERDLVECVDGRQRGQARAVAIEEVELARIDGVHLGEQRVQRRDGVPFRQDERVGVAHPRGLEKDQNFGA